MTQLIDKYADKLIQQNLCARGDPLIGLLDDEIEWNRDDVRTTVLEDVTERLDINSILFARPVEPYASMLEDLATHHPEVIRPEDSETRTFLHDIPVVDHFDVDGIVAALKRRKGLYIRNQGIVTHGTVSPEQAYVTFCSILFAAFVKVFVDRVVEPTDELFLFPTALIKSTMFEYRKSLESLSSRISLMEGPLDDKETLLAAMVDAGKAVVDCGLVDSYFGNLSYRLEDVVYISQTTSSLDELAGLIDACPIDGSSCAGLTASSELSAHSEILAEGGIKSILHGHPKFAVIASMLCEEVDCDHKGRCYNLCPKERFIDETPIVPGEPGSGRYGLSHTLPPAIAGRKGAIVYGHGLFTCGTQDFDIPFRNMIDIELQCLDAFHRRLGTST